MKTESWNDAAAAAVALAGFLKKERAQGCADGVSSFPLSKNNYTGFTGRRE